MAEVYLNRYEIQLENALTEVRHGQSIAPFVEENPYREALLFMRGVMRDYGALLQTDERCEQESAAQAAETAETLREKLQPLLLEKEEHRASVKALEASYQKIVPFIGLNYNVRRILHFNSIKYSFGRMPIEYFRKMQDYVYDSIDAIVTECTRDAEYVYLVYFVPKREEDKVDAVFASLYFEKIFIPDEYDGTPEEAINRLHADISLHRERIFQIDMKIADYLTEHKNSIVSASERLERYAKLFEIRNYAALIKRGPLTFYIICGWMTARQAAAFLRETKQDERLFCFAEKETSQHLNEPPTKLRHFALFRPFELFVELYGLPAYHEIDPTPLLALSYMIFFGFVFGDFGQGAVLLLVGAFLYRKKRLRLAGIIACCGASSMLFGILFGSVFGFEDVLKPLWLNPQRAMMELPLLGKLNAVFVVAAAAGIGMTLLCRLLSAVNAWRQHKKGKALLGQNGTAGLLFYGAAVLCILLFITGRKLPAGILLLLLLYFSNTLSFVRIGAFAVLHAAMMGGVMMLSGAESGGSLNLSIIIAGNLLVCGMEAFIVGIQVLRLKYYGIFSGFYQGGGRAFKPYR